VNHTEPHVFVIDDDDEVRRGLVRLLRAAGRPAEGYASAQDFLERAPRHEPGCLVADVYLPQVDGLVLVDLLRSAGWTLPVIFITGRADVPTTVRAMKRGAIDFLLKPVNEAELLDAIDRAVERDRQERQARAERAEAARRLESLTPRERQVFELVVTGLLNKQIAGDLGTTEQTVKVHRARVMQKMGAASLPDLVRLAAQLNLAVGSAAADRVRAGGLVNATERSAS
jgi:RNA polymerase sigma factor (sigma-70 family)